MFELPSLEKPINITKELLLSRNSEETYMTTYLGLPMKKGLQISPLRSDKRPTASFYRNKNGELIFHDFGSGFHGNFISVVMEINNCNFYQALRIIANDFNIIQSRVCEKTIKKVIHNDEHFQEKEDTLIQIEQKDFSEKELKWWESFGISKNTLQKYNVYSCKSIFLNGHYFTSSSDTNPIFGYYGGKKNGTELWRIYFPRKKNYRFISNWSSKYIQGCRQLSKANYCLITKSMKDCMTFYENGINSCAPNGETIIISQLQFNKIQSIYKDIFVLYDNDLAGVKGAHKYKIKYGVKCIFIKRKYAKDISDLYKKVGKIEFKNVISDLNDILNENKRSSEYFYIF